MDINELPNPNEKKLKSQSNSTRYTKFNNFMQNRDLIDLGYISSPFGDNKTKVEGVIFSRLDYAIANRFSIIYFNATLTHIPNNSYRGPIVIPQLDNPRGE